MFTKNLQVLSLILLLAGCLWGQTEPRNLKDKRITINVERVSLGDVFDQLTAKDEIPIGLELSTKDKEHTDFNFSTNVSLNYKNVIRDDQNTIRATVEIWPVYPAGNHYFTLKYDNGKFSEVFDDIVRQMGDYTWEINNEVVNIYPIKKFRDPNYEKLLELKIKEFVFNKVAIISLIRPKIYYLSEIKEFMKTTSTQNSNARGGDINRGRQRLFGTSVKFENLTLKELLNKITRIKGGGWALRPLNYKHNKNPEIFEIDL